MVERGGTDHSSGAHEEITSWTSRYEKHLSRQSDQIESLTRDVSALSADVRSLMKNQESLFAKTSQPFQWGAFISALGVVAVGAGLLIQPIHREIDDLKTFQAGTLVHRIEDASAMAEAKTDAKWLKMLESRANARLHLNMREDDNND